METILILAVAAIVVLLIMVLKLNKIADNQVVVNTQLSNALSKIQQEHAKLLLMIADQVDLHTVQIEEIKRGKV